MTAPRNAEPIPNATTSARVDAGRAMSGRTGISLASIVRSVIDVPATHSSGVGRICPAWTDAISSSDDSKSLPPTDSMYAAPGWTRTPGRIAVTTIAIRTRAATPAMSGRSVSWRAADGRRLVGRRTPRHLPAEEEADACVDRRETGDEHGRPDERDQEERHEQAARDRADRVDGERANPTLARRVPASSGSSADEAGKATPSAIVTGRTTMNDERNSVSSDSCHLFGVGGFGGDEHQHEAERREDSRDDLAHGQQPDRVAEPRPERREQDGPDREAEEEHREDRREDVGRIARARGEQAGPRHLVAERGQPRHEGDTEGERRDRAATSAA